jgi:dephospho-CoA kinase
VTVLRAGLTGGIGSGKSTVTRLLAARGAVVVDADLVAREVVEPGSDGLAAVVSAFGEQVLRPDGSLDRAALGQRVFADPDARATLNGLLHPRIATRSAELVAEAAARDPDGVLVHDVPLLVENGLARAYDVVVVVDTDPELAVRRLVERRGMREADARARVGPRPRGRSGWRSPTRWSATTGPRRSSSSRSRPCGSGCSSAGAAPRRGAARRGRRAAPDVASPRPGWRPRRLGRITGP